MSPRLVDPREAVVEQGKLRTSSEAGYLQGSKLPKTKSSTGFGCKKGASIIRRGFWGPVYCSYNKETPKTVSVNESGPLY